MDNGSKVLQLTIALEDINKFIESLRELVRVSDTQLDVQQTQALGALEDMLVSGKTANVWPLLLQVVSVAQRSHEEQQQKAEQAFNELIKELLDIEREMVNSFSNTTNALSNNGQRYDRQLDDYMGGLAQEISEAQSLQTLKTTAASHLGNMRKSIQARRVQEQSIIESNQKEISRLSNELVNTRQAMSNLEKERALNQQVALTCPLTGISNKRAMDRFLHQVTTDKSFWPFCLAVVDVDHFKTFNDNFGHQAGDKVLTTITQQISAELRPEDQFFRYAGDEFVIFFNKMNLEAAHREAEKIRAAIEAVRFRYKNDVLQITISIGLAEVKEADTAASIFELADLALLDAKRNQRNCIMTCL